jgi:hypothetical protein
MEDRNNKLEGSSVRKLCLFQTSLMTDKALFLSRVRTQGSSRYYGVVDEMGIQATPLVAPVGCSVLAYEFMNIDISRLHTVGAGAATGIKRCWPDKYVSLTREMVRQLLNCRNGSYL